MGGIPGIPIARSARTAAMRQRNASVAPVLVRYVDLPLRGDHGAEPCMRKLRVFSRRLKTRTQRALGQRTAAIATSFGHAHRNKSPNTKLEHINDGVFRGKRIAVGSRGKRPRGAERSTILHAAEMQRSNASGGAGELRPIQRLRVRSLSH